MIKHFKYMVVSTLLLLLSACASTDSENVASPGIYADFKVTNEGASSHLTAQLKVGGKFSNSVLDLSNGDTLVANNGSQSLTMTRHTNIFGDIEYQTAFANDIGGTHYTITFNRPESNESISSSITLPEDFNLNLINSAVHGPADTLTVSWDTPSVYISRITLSQTQTLPSSGFCGFYTTRVNPGVTSINIPLSLINQLSDSPASCTMKVTVKREASANVNSAFGEGGVFEATVSRNTLFNFAY